MQVSVPSPSPIPVTPIPSGCGDGADGFGGVVIPCCGARPQQLTPSPCPDLGSLQAANPDPEGRGLLCSWVLCLSLHPCVIPAVTHVLLAARQYSQFPGVNPSLVTHTDSVTTNSGGVIRLNEIGSARLRECQCWRGSNGEMVGGWRSGGWEGGAGGQPTALPPPPWGLWASLSPSVPGMRGSSCTPMRGGLGGISSQKQWWCVGTAAPGGGAGGRCPWGCSRTVDVALRAVGSSGGDGLGLEPVVLEVFSDLNDFCGSRS